MCGNVGKCVCFGCVDLCDWSRAVETPGACGRLGEQGECVEEENVIKS